MTTDPTAFRAELAERTVLVHWPDNEQGGATPPVEGWQDRAWAQESTLHEIDEGSVTGCSVLRWRDDPRPNAELLAASLALVTGKPAAAPFPPPADRATLRDRIAGALAEADGWQWAPGYDKTQSPTYQHYLRHADAVLAVLPEQTDHTTLEAACVCGEPGTPDTVHRTDGPCHVDDRRRSIANAIARVDAGKWGTEVPLEDHPFWQVYLAYADAVLELAGALERTDQATLLREAALKEAAAAIQDVIDADRAKFPRRSNDRAALGAARQIVLGLLGNPGRLAAEQPTETQDDNRAAIIAELLPVWEAVYEPGNVSNYLIGYANDQDAATGMAEAWMRSQAEVTGRLEWETWGTATPLPDGYDAWFELAQRHDDGIDTGPGIIVRRRIEPAVGERPDTQTPEAGS